MRKRSFDTVKMIDPSGESVDVAVHITERLEKQGFSFPSNSVSKSIGEEIEIESGKLEKECPCKNKELSIKERKKCFDKWALEIHNIKLDGRNSLADMKKDFDNQMGNK